MRSNKKYLRTKIVSNFFTDVRNVFNRFVILNTIILNNNNNSYIKIHTN